jgi:hypothetical protein
MRMNRLVISIALAGIAAGCRASEEERRTVLESAEHVNYDIARGAVARDLRSPVDSGRLIYHEPTHLSRPSAAGAGARQVWAPFGIARPDTLAPTGTR